jgi:parallel beta-helix repeat protein
MKLKNKDKIVLFASLVLLAIFSIPTLPVSEPSNRVNSQFDVMAGAFSWNTSDYINFHGPLINAATLKMYRIYIDDSDPTRNWTKTASDNDWCTGSGTWGDPYVIENLFIKGNGTGGMIYVKYSSRPFIIRNCWFNYSGIEQYDVGVCLQFTTNGTVEGNIFTYTRGGVTIEHHSTNNTIHNNIMISDHTTAGIGRAIDMGAASNNNTISKNKILNFYDAIFGSDLTDIIVDGNYAENNIWEADYEGHPIHLRWCNDSQLVRNVLAGSFAYGSFEVAQTDCTDNVIENNQVLVNDTWDFAPPELASLQIPTPKISQTTPNSVISLEHSHHNYIAYNIMLISGGGIPGYDLVLLLEIVGVASVIFTIIYFKRRIKK